jgi:hypothetical protein
MNNATIGLILVTTIAVMLIVSANIFPTIQLRQANAASPTAILKDNLRANLGSRNQHLNQQGNCMRTDGCTTSDVGQGTVGNDNSVTGFTDQSTTNITTANAATPGPAGAKGDLGTPGAPGAKGDKGDPGPPRTFVVTERKGESVIVTAGNTNTATSDCNTGELATGGGWSLSLFGAAPPTVSVSRERLGNTGWTMDSHCF